MLQLCQPQYPSNFFFLYIKFTHLKWTAVFMLALKGFIVNASFHTIFENIQMCYWWICAHTTLNLSLHSAFRALSFEKQTPVEALRVELYICPLLENGCSAWQIFYGINFPAINWKLISYEISLLTDICMYEFLGGKV